MTKKASSTPNAKRVQKHRDSVGKEKVRETARRNTAAHRARKEQDRKDLMEGVNLYRASLGEPLFDFTRRKTDGSKSQGRPTYNPPEDVASKMTAEELSEWRKQQKRECKRIAQAKADREKKEEMDLLRQELERLKERHAQVFGLGVTAPPGLHGAAAVMSSREPKSSGISILIEPIAVSSHEYSVSSNETEVQVDHEAVMSSREPESSGISISIEPIAVSSHEYSVSSNETQVQVDHEDWMHMAMLFSC